MGPGLAASAFALRASADEARRPGDGCSGRSGSLSKPEQLKRFFESGRRRRLECPAAAFWMRNIKGGGVEHEAGDGDGADGEEAAILAVGGDGAADGVEMDSCLGHAPG